MNRRIIFDQIWLGELPRMTIPRTSVNKGIKKMVINVPTISSVTSLG